MNVISSLMIVCDEGDNETVKEIFAGDNRVEIVEEVPGKIGIVLETDSTEEAKAFSEFLQRHEKVFDLILAYHNFEDENLS